MFFLEVAVSAVLNWWMFFCFSLLWRGAGTGYHGWYFTGCWNALFFLLRINAEACVDCDHQWWIPQSYARERGEVLVSLQCLRDRYVQFSLVQWRSVALPKEVININESCWLRYSTWHNFDWKQIVWFLVGFFFCCS